MADSYQKQQKDGENQLVENQLAEPKLAEPKLAEQLPFDFPTLNAQSFEDFAIGESNRNAIKLLTLWPNWGHHVLFVVGPSACGKSHLAQSFKKLTEGQVLDAENLPAIDVFLEAFGDKPTTVILEDVQKVSDENAFFHIFNAIKELGGWLLLTSDRQPQQLNLKLPDLASRLKAVPVIEISLPDENLLRAVLIKHFSDRQLLVSEAVINFLIRRMERSFEGVSKLVKIVDTMALSQGRDITVPLARVAIETYEKQNS